MLRRQHRSLILLIGIPIVTAIGGWAAASEVSSPEDVVRPDPVPSLVTEEVVSTVLESAVVSRGDVVESESTSIDLMGDVWKSDDVGQAVYTGRIAKVGEEIADGGVLAEISGRPVFVIQGDVPMYRDLGPGDSGADVKQLENALKRLGHFTETPDDRYDGATEAAVEGLYDELGYPAVDSSESADSGLEAANQAVANAESALEAAENSRTDADVHATEGEIMAAEAAVETAEQRLDEELGSGDSAAIAEAEAALRLAEEHLSELETPPDLSSFDEAVADAQDDLDEAEAARDAIAKSTCIFIPRGEIIAVPDLPREVGTVTAEVGRNPASEAFTLVGSSTEVIVEVSREEAELIEIGSTAELFEESWGLDTTGKIVEVGGDANAGGLSTLRIQPDSEARDALGANIRVSIPVDATDGKVLAVSVASVYTSGDGRTYVDKVVDGTVGSEVVQPIEVALGLVSDSLVEITPKGDLAVGDQVAAAGGR